MERRIDRFAIIASLRFDFPGSERGPSGGSVRASSFGTGLAACYAPSDLRLCGVADLDLLVATGVGVAEGRTEAMLVPRLGARLAFDFFGSPFNLRPFLDVRFALVRPELVFNHEPVFTVPIVSGSLGVLVSWRGP